MLRRQAVVAGALVVAATASGAAGAPSRSAAHLHVRLPVPYPGDVTVARIVVRARPGIGVPARLRLKAVNAARVSPTVVAIGGVVRLHRHPFRYVSSVVIINKKEAPTGRPRRYQRFLDVDLVDTKASPADTRHYFRAHVRVARNVLAHFGRPRAQATLDLFQPVDADAQTPLQKALHDRGLDAIQLAPARSSSARRDTAPPAAILTDTTEMAKAACANDPGHTEKTEKKVESDVATQLNPISSAPTQSKRCDLSRYSFKNLKVTYSAPGEAGAKSTFAYSNVAGSVCGDPAKTAWGITYASTGEGSRTAKAAFAGANPATIANRAFGAGNSIALRLQYSTDDLPVMKISALARGKVTNVVAKPAQVSLASTAVDTCS